MFPEFLLAEAKSLSAFTGFFESDELEDLYSEVHVTPVVGVGKV